MVAPQTIRPTPIAVATVRSASFVLFACSFYHCRGSARGRCQTVDMSITLVPITLQRFPSWLKRSQSEYKTDLIATGETPRAAEEHSSDALERAFPAGAPTPGNTVFDLVDDIGQIVGYLWIGRDNSDDASSWWVWDVVIEPEHRGRGYGRAAMQLAEDHARAQGARTLGLSVFGFNAVARGLYESAGYETTSVKMRKQL